MKTTRTSLVAFIATISIVFSSCGSAPKADTDATTTTSTVVAASEIPVVNAVEIESETSVDSGLTFEKYYIIMPKLDVRADPDTPGKTGEVVAGQEVEFLYSAGIYSMFRYQDETGTTKTGATWTGGIAPGIRIHLLEDAFIYHHAGQSRDQLGTISTWRESSDPDLIILGEEYSNGETWLFVLSIEDCRAGYMKSTVKYEIKK